MPKVGDKIIFLIDPDNEYVVTEVNMLMRCFWTTAMQFSVNALSPTWSWEDPTVEAQRLQEAAWRADTSPFQQEVLDALNEYGGNLAQALSMLTQYFIQTDDAETALRIVPQLLRWQAQQEGGAND